MPDFGQRLIQRKQWPTQRHTHDDWDHDNLAAQSGGAASHEKDWNKIPSVNGAIAKTFEDLRDGVIVAQLLETDNKVLVRRMKENDM